MAQALTAPRPKRIHKATVKARLRKGERFTGYICASNVNSFHVVGGWHIGHSVDVGSIEELDKIMQNYAIYNCGPELGQRVYCWE